MTRPFANLTWRNALIATHDALATIAAVLISFYLRFEHSGLLGRLPLRENSRYQRGRISPYLRDTKSVAIA